MKTRSLFGLVLSFALLVLFGCGGDGGGGVQQFTITATAGAGGGISPTGAVTVVSGANQTFTITPNAGFVVADVLVDGVSQGAITTFTFTNVTANHTITASFAANPTITATAGVGGGISPTGAVTVVSGSSQTFTITPNAGFVVADVLVDGVSQGAITTFTFTNVTTNHTIVASFTFNPTIAVVKVATQGTLPAGTQIGAIQATLNYATGTGLSIAANNVVASGAGTNSFLAANTNTAGQVGMGLINATGILPGEFATATFSIAAGNVPTAADFGIVVGPTVNDLNGAPIPGISVVISSVVFQ